MTENDSSTDIHLMRMFPWGVSRLIQYYHRAWLATGSRYSSAGRASDWRSEGPWFNPGWRHITGSCHIFFLLTNHIIIIHWNLLHSPTQILSCTAADFIVLELPSGFAAFWSHFNKSFFFSLLEPLTKYIFSERSFLQKSINYLKKVPS